MQGLGNDYIFVDCKNGAPEHANELAVEMSRRHVSVGSDGLVLILKSDTADARMRIFNADGSEAEICGNALRCVGSLLYDLRGKERMTVETKAGVHEIQITDIMSEKVKCVKVNMGVPSFSPHTIPMDQGPECVDQEFFISGEKIQITALSVGNPHAVIFLDSVDSLEKLDIKRIGYAVEHCRYFKNRINVEFAVIVGSNDIRYRVWERGSGETFACGSGACAVACASIKLLLTDKSKPVKVRSKVGELIIEQQPNGSITLEGQCETVYKGTYFTD